MNHKIQRDIYSKTFGDNPSMKSLQNWANFSAIKKWLQEWEHVYLLKSSFSPIFSKQPSMCNPSKIASILVKKWFFFSPWKKVASLNHNLKNSKSKHV